MEEMSFWLIWAMLGGAMLIYYIRCTHTVRSMLWGAISGVAALVLVHYAGAVIGFSPELNLFNIMQSGILGIPGVALMAAAHIFL